MAVISLEASHFKLIPKSFVAEDVHPVPSLPGRLYCLACLLLSFEPKLEGCRFCFSPERHVCCACIFLCYQYGLVKDGISLPPLCLFFRQREKLSSTNANLCIKHYVCASVQPLLLDSHLKVTWSYLY